jgi:hypothetical protein
MLFERSDRGMKQRTYIAIDLKSFYASVECRERGLDPMDTNLVVADESRTDKTICLAVTPSLKSYGISGRGRLFEVKQRIKEANIGRRHDAPGRRQDGSSHLYSELQANPELAIDFKGDLNKLYNQVKVLYGMQQSKDFDGRVNSLLSGLEKIVQAVAEMRNANSDAHGVGSRRIVIRESEARLVMNSAITFCEYMISGHGKCK